jgi:hypothetical protein
MIISMFIQQMYVHLIVIAKSVSLIRVWVREILTILL